jgi:hypothetical protein
VQLDVHLAYPRQVQAVPLQLPSCHVRRGEGVLAAGALSGIGEVSHDTPPSAEPCVPLSKHTAPRSNASLHATRKRELAFPRPPLMATPPLTFIRVSSCSVVSLRPIPAPRQPPFRVVMRPVRQGMDSLCLSASGLRFLGPLVPAGDFRRPHGWRAGSRQTPSGLPRSTFITGLRRSRLSSGGTASAQRDA